ncbi:hypothetical protein SDC9_144759 [bioreactor metagenome]|uniref:Uncharacterized protein n=1 Tax=bioreactor metagenome TaxID=1076179 RepID=A0A645E6Y3_9ZZZZ
MFIALARTAQTMGKDHHRARLGQFPVQINPHRHRAVTFGVMPIQIDRGHFRHRGKSNHQSQQQQEGSGKFFHRPIPRLYFMFHYNLAPAV